MRHLAYCLLWLPLALVVMGGTAVGQNIIASGGGIFYSPGSFTSTSSNYVETLMYDIQSTVYEIQDGHTITITGGSAALTVYGNANRSIPAQLSISRSGPSGPGKLSVQAGARVDLMNSQSYLSNSGELEFTGATVNNGGIIENYGHITFGNGTVYNTNGLGRLTSSYNSSYTIDGRISANSIYSIVNAVNDGLSSYRTLGTVTFTNEISTGQNINLSNLYAGTVVIQDHQANFSNDVDVGSANLIIGNGDSSAGTSTFSGTVTSKTLTVKSDTAFSGTVANDNFTVGSGATATFEAGATLVLNNVTIDTSSSLVANQGIHNVTIVNNGTFVNNANSSIDNGYTYSGSGTLVNNATLTFAENATYSGTGSINNSGGTLVFSGKTANAGALVNALTPNIGTVEMYGSLSDMGSDINIAATGGTLKLMEQSLSGGRSINIGEANLEIATGEFKNVTAANITANGMTTFYGAVRGNLASTNQTVIFDGAAASFSGGDLIVDGSGLLYNNNGATITIATGKTLKGGSTLYNRGTLNLEAGATYVNSGVVDNSQGIINLNTGATNAMDLFNDIAGVALGSVNITGDIGGDIARGSATSGGVTLKTQQSGNRNIDLGGASLALEGGGAFGQVNAANIYSYGVTNFNGAVTGGLAIQTGTTTLVAGMSGGNLIVNSGATLNNGNGSTVDASGNAFANSGTVVNSGTITTSQGSQYGGAGTIDNSASTAVINTHASMSGFDSMMHAVKTQNLGVINIAGSVNSNLNINAAAGTVNLTTSQATHYATTINLGAADLNTAGGTFSGAVTAANIASSENVVFEGVVQGNLTAAQDLTFDGNGSGFANGNLTFSGFLDNNGGVITIGSGKTFNNAGAQTTTNTGTLLFLNGSSYVGGASIINTGGFLGVNTGMSGYATVLSDLDATQNIGIVNISGTLTSDVNIAASQGGTVQLASANMSNRDVNVDQARLVILGSGQLHDVTANGGIEVNNNANFTGQLRGDLALVKLSGASNTPTATFELGSNLNDSNITVNAGTVLNNQQGTIIISAGKAVVNNGAITNTQQGTMNGEFTFVSTARYSGAGVFNNAGGILDVDAGMSGFNTLITNLAPHDVGSVRIRGALAGELRSSALSGTFNLLNAQNTNSNINVNQASLDIYDGGTFTGGVTAGKISVFNQNAEFDGKVSITGTGVDSALVAESGVNVTLRSNIDMEGGLIGHGSGGFVLQAGGLVTVTQGKKLQLENGNFDNSGALAFGKHADFSLTGGGIIQNRGGSALAADLAMPNIDALLGASHMDAGSTLNLVNSQDITTLASTMTIGSASAGSTVNINGDLLGQGTGKVVLSGASLNFGQADVYYNRGVLDLQNGAVGTAGSFRTAGGTKLVVNTAGGSTSTITAATSYIASSVDLGKADRLLFNGNVTFSGNAAFTIDADDLLYANGGQAGNIKAVGGDIAFDSAGTYSLDFVNATLDGSNLAGKPLFEVDAGQSIANYHLLSSPLYNLVYRNNMVFVQDRKAIITVLETMFDPATINKNKISLAHYLTTLPGTISTELSIRLANYFRTGVFDAKNGYLALGQMVGEYGAYANTSLLHANDLFFRNVFDRMNQRIDKAWQRCAQPSIYNEENPAGISSGGVGAFDFTSDGGAFWGGYLGSRATQQMEHRISGYDFSGDGMIIGYDRRFDRLDVGLAAAYLSGGLNVNEMATTINSDMYNLGAYGSYISELGPIVKAGLGYGMGANDYKVNMVIGGPKFGKFDNRALSASGEIGYPLCLFERWDLTPAIGLNYVNYRHDSWTETFDALETSPISVANWFEKQAYDRWEVPIGARLNRNFDFYGHAFAGEVRATWIQSLGSREPCITTGFVGAKSGTPVWGVEESKNRLLLGASVRSNLSDRLFATLSYDFEMRSHYRNHSVTANLEAVF